MKWVTPHTSVPQCLDNSLPGFFSCQGYLVCDNSSKDRKCHQQTVPFLLSPASASGSLRSIARGLGRAGGMKRGERGGLGREQRRPSPGEAWSPSSPASVHLRSGPWRSPHSVTWSPLLSGCNLAKLFDLSKLPFPPLENDDGRAHPAETVVSINGGPAHWNH